MSVAIVPDMRALAEEFPPFDSNRLCNPLDIIVVHQPGDSTRQDQAAPAF
jgi:hypothetical protein